MSLRAAKREQYERVRKKTHLLYVRLRQKGSPWRVKPVLTYARLARRMGYPPDTVRKVLVGHVTSRPCLEAARRVLAAIACEAGRSEAIPTNHKP